MQSARLISKRPARISSRSYFLTIVYLPPAEDTARAESWLYEGREQSGINPWEILHSNT